MVQYYTDGTVTVTVGFISKYKGGDVDDTRLRYPLAWFLSHRLPSHHITVDISFAWITITVHMGWVNERPKCQAQNPSLNSNDA